MRIIPIFLKGLRKNCLFFRVGGGGMLDCDSTFDLFFFLRGLKSTYLILMGVGCGYEMERPLSEWC